MTIGIKVRILAAAASLSLCLSQGVGLAQGDTSWKASFEETCSKSNEAMKLSANELKALLEKCDALEKVIGQEEESLRKVYLKRLQLCKNLYAYMLEYKKSVESSQLKPGHE